MLMQNNPVAQNTKLLAHLGENEEQYISALSCMAIGFPSKNKAMEAGKKPQTATTCAYL